MKFTEIKQLYKKARTTIHQHGIPSKNDIRFLVQYWLMQSKFAELEAENERLKSNESALLNAIADWYYLHPNPTVDEVLNRQYENFLTFGQSDANFDESQKLNSELEVKK
jgi:hypothetical protein